MDCHGQVHLLEEVLALFIGGLLRRELGRDNGLKHVLKFFLHLANLWRNQLPHLGVNRWRRAEQVLDLKLLHEILSVGLGALIQRQFLVKVNLLVFVHHALGNLRSLSELRLEVLFVLTSKCVDKWPASLELRHGHFANCDSLSALL